MRINIEEYQNAYKTLEEEIRNELFGTFKEKETKIKTKIATIITDSVNMDSSLINDFVQEELIENLYREQIKTADLVCERVNTITSYTKNLVEQIGEGRGESWFNFLRNELTRTLTTQNSEEILQEFIKSIPRFLEIRLGREVDEDTLFNIMTSIKASIKQDIYDAFDMVKEVIKNKTNAFVSKLTITNEKDDKNDITVQEVNQIRETAKYLGYLIIDENNKTYLVSDDKKIPLIKQTDGTLYAGDADITFYVNNPNHIIAHRDKDVLVVASEYISFGVEHDPENIKINLGFLDEPTILCNGEKIDDPIKMGIIISTIKRRFPALHEDLSKQIGVTELFDRCAKAKEESQKIIKDENGIAHLNLNTLDEFTNYLEVIGYRPIEKEDGVYLENEFGEEVKVQYRDGVILLPNGIQIAIDFYIAGLSGIKGPDIYYKDKENQRTLFYAEDFSQIDLIVDEGHFRVNADSNGINYRTMIGDIVEKNEALVTEMFNKYYPALLSKLKANYNALEEDSLTSALLSELDETPEETIAEVIPEEEQDNTLQDNPGRRI